MQNNQALRNKSFIFITMKLDKLIYDVRETLSQYQDDSNISDEYIAYLIGIYRAEILKNELNNLQRVVNHLNTQSLCLELEEVSTLECGLEIDCKTIMRSKQPVPSPIKTHLGHALTSVKPSDKITRPFSVISEERVPYLQHSKYNNSIYYFLGTDAHVYLYSKSETYKFIDCITVQGVFADPLDLSEYKNCCGCKDTDNNVCYNPLTSNYPITSDQVRTVIDMITNKLINKLRITEDTQNNSNDQ